MDHELYEKLFEQECYRKSRLLNLIEAIETPFSGRKKLARKFRRVVKGEFEIQRIEGAALEIVRPSGERIFPVRVTHEIAKEFRLNDSIFALLGQNENGWHFVRLEYVLSSLKEIKLN